MRIFCFLMGSVTVMFLISGLAHAAVHPNIYLNQAEIDAVKAKVSAGKEPWSSAYKKMMSEANAALKQSPLSVTYGGKRPPSGKKNDYYSAYPGGNSKADRTDYKNSAKLGNAVRNLGLAYAFNGNPKYAAKARQLIRVWCLDPATRMNPFFPDRQSCIELYITLPGVFWGADLIWNDKGWSASEKRSFQKWCSALIANAKDSKYRDEVRCPNLNCLKNFEDFRLNLIAAGAVVAEEPANLTYAFDTWKRNLPYRISGGAAFYGAMKAEYGRRTHMGGLGYSMYALKALSQTCEIARHHGVDLYHYTVSGAKGKERRGLELAFDAHVKYNLNFSSWPFSNAKYKGGESDCYELAYLIWGKPEYLSVVKKFGRPIKDRRIMGWVSLTHARGAYPTKVVSPRSKPRVKTR